jgi:hypothetical protein
MVGGFEGLTGDARAMSVLNLQVNNQNDNPSVRLWEGRG